ncbi:MAG TPA: beta-ketoacyl reductase, partial [Mycolicibacterium fallax]|nr:beta-ketoacyl reductase [Mycolicibacterium fallax]
EFVEQLRELGAEVELRACDVADAESVAQVVADVAAAHRVVGVVHAAGVLDDGVLESMDAERITTVFDPKANGAWNLHAATRQLGLEFFVMCSSVAGVFGSPGQTNYAAANGYLDGLAAWRRAHALPATSIAWGLWSDSSSLTAKVLDSGADSIDRLGVRGFSPAEAVAAFDEALLSPGASTLVVRMEEDAASLLKLRTTLPPKRSRSTEPARRPADPAAAPPLREVLAAAAPEAREDLTIEAVCREIAATVGMTDQAGVDPDCSYRELGFDSLMAVEFRNRLNSLTGLRLPAAVVLDQPTPRLLAQSIVAALQDEAGEAASVPGELAAAR